MNGYVLFLKHVQVTEENSCRCVRHFNYHDLGNFFLVIKYMRSQWVSIHTRTSNYISFIQSVCSMSQMHYGVEIPLIVSYTIAEDECLDERVH